MYSHPNIDLNQLIKLPLLVLCDSNDVSCTHWSYEVIGITRHDVERLKPYYLNAVLIFKDIVYLTAWLQRARTQDRDLKLKLTVIKPYYVGIEFAHTKPIVSKDYPRLVELVHGEGFLLMYPQDIVDIEYNLEQIENKVFLVPLKAGQKAVVPPNWVYVLINRNNTPAIFLEIHHPEQTPNIVEKKKKRAPFYVVVRNERPEIVKNPDYRYVRNLVSVDPEGVSSALSLALRTPLLNQFLRSTRKFAWFLDSNLQQDEYMDILLSSILEEDED